MSTVSLFGGAGCTLGLAACLLLISCDDAEQGLATKVEGTIMDMAYPLPPSA